MNPRYVLTTPARADIRDILLYVDERFGRVVARRVRDTFYETFGNLADHPGMGHTRTEDWPEHYGFFPLGPSLVAYRADVRPIRIIRIARASRDWQRIEPHE